MKRLLLAGLIGFALMATRSANAADMPVKAPPPPPAPVYSWAGFYAGINAGYSLANDPFNQTLFAGNIISTSSIDSRVTPQGGLFGGQLGYNYQVGNAVFGLEGDFQWTNEHDTAGCGLVCQSDITGTEIQGSVEQRIKWFGTARGRLGYANNSWLLYVTGGGAWGGIDATTTYSQSGAGTFSNTSSFTKGGWVVGAGTEVRLAGPWSAKLEYLYMNLGNITDTISVLNLFPFSTNSSIRDHIVRVGLNYAFNGTPTLNETPARAVHMVVKAPPPPPAPVYSWAGFYAGINAGYSLANDPFNQTLNVSGFIESSSIDSRVTPQGGLFGGQLGYNYQVGNAVFGVEGDLQWTDEHDTAGCSITCVSTPAHGVIDTLGSVEQRIKWFGTARGRLGYANNGWLLYVTGGGAWGGVDTTQTFTETLVTGVASASNTTSSTKGGWVVGAGTEVRLAGPWSAKLEYLYMDLAGVTTTPLALAPLGFTSATTNTSIRDHVIRGGLNYKLN